MRTLSKLLLPFVLLALGCGGTTSGGVYRTPMVERGACATILMPGQSMPMPEPGESPGCAGGYASIAGGGVVEEGEKTTKSEPHPAVKVLTAPFAILLFPFKVMVAGAEKLGDLVDGDDEVPLDPRLRGAQGKVAKVDPQVAHEREQLGALERELAKRGGQVRSSASGPAMQTGSATPATPAPSGAAATPTSSSSSRLRLADELAALRGGAATPAAAPRATAPVAPSPGEAPTLPPADRVLDRDGDGQPDHWIHLQNGQVAREHFDENRDHRPDRTVWRDPVTGHEQRVEEDRNGDGRADLISEYKDGQLARVRRDDNYDGAPDGWSYYREGTLVREELDPDGDGFRNRVALYEDGRLTREREDRDGDGRVDRLTHYDAQERIARRDEDQDGDGLVDARAFYEDGRLVRREL
ncbi:MAG: hypothetical protein ABFS41_16755, partial [Myxococcota bacterium]